MRNKYKIVGLPWAHGCGTDVSDCKTSREVMEKANLNWTVNKCPVVARMPATLDSMKTLNPNDNDFVYGGDVYRDCPNGFATYRTDLDVPLGFVKSKYEVVQNTDAFSFFDDAIGTDKAVWQYAGYFGFGHKIYVAAKLPVDIVVGNDKIDNYLVFSNSHDGSSSVDILFTPIRVFCLNTLNSAIKNADSHIRLRHTKSVKDRINRGAEVLRIACTHAATTQILYNSLLTMKMSDKDVMKYLAQLQLNDNEIQNLEEFDKENGYKKLMYKDYLTLERTNISTRKANIISSMFDYYLDGIAQKHILGTAWGAYNAVTGYYSNVANLEGERRTEGLLWGGANNMMNKALERVMLQAA